MIRFCFRLINSVILFFLMVINLNWTVNVHRKILILIDQRGYIFLINEFRSIRGSVTGWRGEESVGPKNLHNRSNKRGQWLEDK